MSTGYFVVHLPSLALVTLLGMGILAILGFASGGPASALTWGVSLLAAAIAGAALLVAWRFLRVRLLVAWGALPHGLHKWAYAQGGKVYVRTGQRSEWCLNAGEARWLGHELLLASRDAGAGRDTHVKDMEATQVLGALGIALVALAAALMTLQRRDEQGLVARPGPLRTLVAVCLAAVGVLVIAWEVAQVRVSFAWVLAGQVGMVALGWALVEFWDVAEGRTLFMASAWIGTVTAVALVTREIVREELERHRRRFLAIDLTVDEAKSDGRSIVAGATQLRIFGGFQSAEAAREWCRGKAARGVWYVGRAGEVDSWEAAQVLLVAAPEPAAVLFASGAACAALGVGFVFSFMGSLVRWCEGSRVSSS